MGSNLPPFKRMEEGPLEIEKGNFTRMEDGLTRGNPFSQMGKILTRGPYLSLLINVTIFRYATVHRLGRSRMKFGFILHCG